MIPFAHLHLHTQYSLLDGANRITDLVAAAAAAGIPALAITDHGNLFGALEFYDLARAGGIQPIIGMEAYVAQGPYDEKDPARSSSNHLVLLATNETGFRNLIKLTTRSYLEGFYYKPRIDHRLLQAHAEGLIALSACLKGELNERILAGQREDAEARARLYRDIFGPENFFLELQDHGIPAQRQVNVVLRDLARKLALETVITNDCHYLRREDAFAHDVLLCIGTQKVLTDQDRLRYATEEFYLKSGEELLRAFPEDRRAIDNTLSIAERCRLELPEGQSYLPIFPVPSGETLETYLTRIAEDGLRERLSERQRFRTGRGRALPDELYRERLRFELDVINRMGFAGYFLVVWDFIRHARSEGIPVGPGRGSAAGSLVAYVLRITDVDPLAYGLLFERFLNPERKSMPDIDVDFCMRRRSEVIQYVQEKYGREHVAQIITFGTLAAKGVLRDVGRVLGLPYSKVDRVAKLIPDMTRSIAEASRTIESLIAEMERDPEVRQAVEVGARLEGLTRHASVHAAGVVIAPQPIDTLVPLYRTSRDEVTTQWDMKGVERLGLLKIDFLGLKTVTVLEDTVALLRRRGIELNLPDVPLDDPAVFELFGEARTNGIFQFESSGMKDMLRRAKPSRFEDLSALNALYRPGALSVRMVDEFIERKHGRKKVTYFLPELEPILQETYGVIAYQEQVMQIAVTIAGFTMGQADLLRKAMGKKNAQVMAEQKERFLAGAEKRGVARRKAQDIWDYIEPFAGYGFNKSHSVAYALLAYRTAYLKVHYPVEFFAAMLSAEMSSTDEIVKYVNECRELGIAILPPDVNRSDWPFVPEGEQAIRFGLGGIKGLGEAAGEAILSARRQFGAFRSIEDLATRVDSRSVNAKVWEALVKSGACDGFGKSRAALCAALDQLAAFAQKRREASERGQGALFGDGDRWGASLPLSNLPEWDEEERLRYEKETLGFFLSGHPLRDLEDELRQLRTHAVEELRQGIEGEVVVAGMAARIKRHKIKSGASAGRVMARFVLEDLSASVEVAVFPDVLQRIDSVLQDGAVLVLRGQVRSRGSDVELILGEVEPFEDARRRLLSALVLTVAEGRSRSDLLRVRNLLADYPGSARVQFAIEVEGKIVRIQPDSRFRVELNDALVEGLERILGVGSVAQCRESMRDRELAPLEVDR